MAQRISTASNPRPRARLAAKLAWSLLALVLGVAALASFLASDRPLLLSWQDRLYLLPNVIDHAPLRDLSGDDLRARMTRDDWALWPPVPHDPTAVRSRGAISPLEPPSSRHWLGTDDRGRDVLARLIHGTRATVLMAAGAALLALGLGVLLAGVAAWAHDVHREGHAGRAGRGALGGRTPGLASLAWLVDITVVALCDAVAAMPALVVVVAAQGLLARPSLAAAVVLIALVRAADTARMARGMVLAALAQPFCLAARGLGARRIRVVLVHALPQAGPHLAVATAITAATAVLAEAALGFLGFGAPPPAASWGELLRQAHHNQLRWYLVMPAGLAVAVTAAALGALAQPRERAYPRRAARPWDEADQPDKEHT